jgi:hypothetical protein
VVDVSQDKTDSCKNEFGSDATMMDLELMEGELPKVDDLQHALYPLFEDPHAM